MIEKVRVSLQSQKVNKWKLYSKDNLAQFDNSGSNAFIETLRPQGTSQVNPIPTTKTKEVISVFWAADFQVVWDHRDLWSHWRYLCFGDDSAVGKVSQLAQSPCIAPERKSKVKLLNLTTYLLRLDIKLSRITWVGGPWWLLAVSWNSGSGTTQQSTQGFWLKDRPRPVWHFDPSRSDWSGLM